jgi:hypothetical protein
LAQDVILLCGLKTASWITICRVFTWTRLVEMQYDLSAKPSFILDSEWHFLLQCGGFKHPFDLIAHVKSSQATSVAGAQQLQYRPSESLYATKFEQHRKRLDGFQLHRLHAFAFRYRTTNPKDYIYGMTGVSGYQVIPDYSRNTTVAQVYQKLVEDSLIAVTDKLKKGIPKLDPDVFWFLGWAMMGFDWRLTSDLPNWALDFAGASEAHSRRYIEPFAIFDSKLGFNDRNLRAKDMPYNEGPILYCKPILVDEVHRIGPVLHLRKPVGKKLDGSEDWLLQLFDCVVESQADSRGPTGFDLFSEICKLLSEKGKISRQGSTRFLEIIVADLEYLCDTRRDLQRADFAAKLFKEPTPSQTDDLLRRSDWSYARARDNGTIFENQNRVSDPRLYTKVAFAVSKLCIAFTTSGQVGLLPPLAQVVDIVGVIKGFSLPVVLRKSGDGYSFIGPCHMPGYMKGEAAEMLQDGRARLEEIRIY